MIENYFSFGRKATFPLHSTIYLQIKEFSLQKLLNFSLREMATLRNRRQVAAVLRETQEEHPKNSKSRNTSVPGITEEYINKVSEDIESRVTKKLIQEFSKTESCILGALSKLDNFLFNLQVRTFSGTVPETSRNTNVESQEPTGDRCKNDPHLGVEFSACRTSSSVGSDPEETSHSFEVLVTQKSTSKRDKGTELAKEIHQEARLTF